VAWRRAHAPGVPVAETPIAHAPGVPIAETPIAKQGLRDFFSVEYNATLNEYCVRIDAPGADETFCLECSVIVVAFENVIEAGRRKLIYFQEFFGDNANLEREFPDNSDYYTRIRNRPFFLSDEERYPPPPDDPRLELDIGELGPWGAAVEEVADWGSKVLARNRKERAEAEPRLLQPYENPDADKPEIVIARIGDLALRLLGTEPSRCGWPNRSALLDATCLNQTFKEVGGLRFLIRNATRFVFSTNFSHPMTAAYWAKFVLTCNWLDGPSQRWGRGGLGLWPAFFVVVIAATVVLGVVGIFSRSWVAIIGAPVLFIALVAWISLAYHIGPRCFAPNYVAPYPMIPQELLDDAYANLRLFDRADTGFEKRYPALFRRVPDPFNITATTLLMDQDCRTGYGFGATGATWVVGAMRFIWPSLPGRLLTTQLWLLNVFRAIPELSQRTGTKIVLGVRTKGDAFGTPLERMARGDAHTQAAYDQCVDLMKWQAVIPYVFFTLGLFVFPYAIYLWLAAVITVIGEATHALVHIAGFVTIWVLDLGAAQRFTYTDDEITFGEPILRRLRRAFRQRQKEKTN